MRIIDNFVMKKSFLFVLLCAVTQWVWSQNPTVVSTDSEIRAAIQVNNANIQLGADINLSNSTLSIPAGNTVTLDLNGHKLDRNLTQRGQGGGQVITVRQGATLNLSNGTLFIKKDGKTYTITGAELK